MIALRGGAPALVVLLTIACPSVSRADPPPRKEQCFDAYEQAQRLRKDYKLRAAHAQLLTCAADACPSFVRQDCSRWLAEVEASTPTIVVLAKHADGSAIDGAKATLDGAPLGESLDGRAVPVDPGPHDLRCEANGTVAQKHIVVAEGQKNQPFYVTMDAAPAPASESATMNATATATPTTNANATATTAATATGPSSENTSAPEQPKPAPVAGGTWHGLPTATWILGGVAAVGAVSFVVFGVMGRSVQSCAPTCTQSQVDELRRDYLVADVSWITGLVAAGAALYFALTAPPSAPAPTQATTAIRW